MEFYRQKSKIWDLFEKANIHSLIAPFGFSTPYKDYNFQTKCRLICQPEYAEKNKDVILLRQGINIDIVAA